MTSFNRSHAFCVILAVSRSTVKFHVINILSKLGVNSRSEAVGLPLHQNLVTWLARRLATRPGRKLPRWPLHPGSSSCILGVEQ